MFSFKSFLGFCLFLALFCVSTPFSLAQTPGPNGFYYPVASVNTAATFLETGCDGYIAQHYHLGWDLGQSRGSNVYAITAGTIVNVTNTGDPDVTFIWVRHQAVDPTNGSTFNFWAVYGHTSIASGLGQGSTVQAGQVIGQTIAYPNGDHCHFGINRNGIITTISYPTITYINNSGQTASVQEQAGWGRGTLPSDWCGHNSQNKSTLQGNSAATENFTDPQSFLTTYKAVGYSGGGSDTDIFVSLSGNDGSNGSSGSPFRTIKHAIDAASATQPVTIHIAPGSYGEKIGTGKHIHFVVNGSGTVQTGG